MLRGVWIFPTALLVIAAGLPEAAVLFHGLALSQFFAPTTAKPCAARGVGGDPVRYYHCLEHAAWTRRPWMLQLGMRGLQSAPGWFVTLAFVGAVGALLYAARLAAREQSVEPDASDAVDGATAGAR